MRVLVVYASRYGSTRGIAERIAETLNQKGVEASVQPVQHADNPRHYDAVVIGSAVYYAHWKKRALRFVQRNREVLAGKPVWLFSSGPLGTKLKNAEGRDLSMVAEPKEINMLRETIKPRDHRVFFGALIADQLGLSHRLMRKLPVNQDNALFPLGDFRNWQEVDAWALSIVESLKPNHNLRA